MAERMLLNFHLYCGIHDEKFESLEVFAKHHKEMGVDPKSIKVICGCCGEYFKTAGELSAHHNMQGFKFGESTIWNFNQENFNYKQQFLFQTCQSQVTLQAASCREQETAHRHRSCALSDSPIISATFPSPVYVRKRAFTEEELEGASVFRKKTPKLPSEPSSSVNFLVPSNTSDSSVKPEGTLKPCSVSLTSVLNYRTNLTVKPKPVLPEPDLVQGHAPLFSSEKPTLTQSRALPKVRKPYRKNIKPHDEGIMQSSASC